MVGVMVTQPQRRGVGGAARLGDQPRLERRARRRHARRLASRRAGLGGEGDVELAVTGDRPRRAGEDAAEFIEGLRPGHGLSRQALCATLSGRSVPNTRW